MLRAGFGRYGGVGNGFPIKPDHGGSIMSRITTRELKARRQDFLQEAGKAFDQMLGSDGQNGLVTFQEREDRACELGDALTRRLLEEHLAADESADPGEAVECPFCGRPVPCEAPEEVELEKRRVQTRRGGSEFERAGRYCKPCRRVFFPLG